METIETTIIKTVTTKTVTLEIINNKKKEKNEKK